MDRREFLKVSSGVVAMAALSACERQHEESQPISAGAKELTAGEFQSTRKFVATDHGRIAYIERGSGPAAIFLHGFPLNSFQWRGVIPQLSGLRRCIAPDFLALGFTEVGEGKSQSVAPAAQVEMLAQLLDKLSVSTTDIVANDSGGAIAQLFVARWPQRVRTLLLTNCDTEPDSPPAAVLPVIELARAGKFADEWLVPWLSDKSLARSEKGLGGQCYGNPAHPTDEAVNMYLGPLVSSPQRKALTNAYAIALAPNPLAGIEAALKRCEVPTRIVWGMADKIFSQTGAGYLDHTFSHSKGVRRLDEAKLFFPEEIPEVIVEEAKRLWAR
jgi:pimeloyl-ACP methyl ester carboxylesterase